MNPRAGALSLRGREVIVKALAADFKIDVAETGSRAHAIELGREAVRDGFEAVVAMGGDGTINETAQGLVGTDCLLGLIPTGSTNVMARSLGVPSDPVEATAFLSARLKAHDTTRMNVGRIGDRYFLFSAGMGLDAAVVAKVEDDPVGDPRKREWVYMKHAWATAVTEYRKGDPAITIEVAGHEPVRAVFFICANARPWTYFKRWAVDACPLAKLEGGLDLFALRKVRLLTAPRVAWSVFVSRSHPRWQNSHYFHDEDAFRISSTRPLPVQVDGDYLGLHTSAAIELVPKALEVLV